MCDLSIDEEFDEMLVNTINDTLHDLGKAAPTVLLVLLQTTGIQLTLAVTGEAFGLLQMGPGRACT